jgi:hypothetical protein
LDFVLGLTAKDWSSFDLSILDTPGSFEESNLDLRPASMMGSGALHGTSPSRNFCPNRRNSGINLILSTLKRLLKIKDPDSFIKYLNKSPLPQKIRPKTLRNASPLVSKRSFKPSLKKKLFIPCVVLLLVVLFSAHRASQGPSDVLATSIFAPNVAQTTEVGFSYDLAQNEEVHASGPIEGPSSKETSVRAAKGEVLEKASSTQNTAELASANAPPKDKGLSTHSAPAVSAALSSDKVKSLPQAPFTVEGSLGKTVQIASLESLSTKAAKSSSWLTDAVMLSSDSLFSQNKESIVGKDSPRKLSSASKIDEENLGKEDNSGRDPLQVVRTVDYVPGDNLSDQAKSEEGQSAQNLSDDYKLEGVLGMEEEEESEEAFGGGDNKYLLEGEELNASQAGEAVFGPEMEPDYESSGDISLPLSSDGPRIVKVIGYTPGSPLDKEILAGFLGQERLSGLESGYLELHEPTNGALLHIKTTFDKELQAEAEKWVKSAGSLDAALVVIDPLDGRVLAMAGSGSRSKLNPAVSGSFPAASVFKIITAAAAIERNNYTRDSYVLFDGGRHTLYKGNVVKEPDVGRHKSSLKDSFAHSINSVFGKLGIYTLGPDALKEAAESFRFNSPILFEMEVTPSSFVLEDREDSFMLAGLASGYNRTTKVSPLHAAMVVASVYNGGKIMEPYFVEEVSDGSYKLLYQGAPKALGEVMSQGTALELWELLKAAVYEGTGRKRFYDAETHKVLKHLDLGGKSGTINDTDGNSVDWFVALSRIKDQDGAMSRPLAIAAVIVHNGRTRTSSQELVRRAVLSYYKEKVK